MQRYLIGYLKDNTNDELISKYIDMFKSELDWYIYNYGNHMSPSYTRNPSLSIIRKLFIEYQYYLSISSRLKLSNGLVNVLSSVNFTKEISFDKLGYNLLSSIFQPRGKSQIIGDRESVLLIKQIKKALSNNGQFIDLFNVDLFNKLENNKINIQKQFRKLDIRALFLYTDQYYSSKYLIDIFKIIERPSFIFTHGLPAIYSLDVDNRSDYLMVWGDKIKENYVNMGFDSQKIKVVGNVKYMNFSLNNNPKNTLDDVLVLPTSSILMHQHEWKTTPSLIDRSMIILYLYQVQDVLQRFGVKSARFRPHPSFNKEWVYSFLDHDFYKVDSDSFNNSINQATLVIGATSTSVLEVLMKGVNYLIYEPMENGLGINRSKLAPPFDGSDSGIAIARTMDDLEYMIKNKYISSEWDFSGYIQPLDLSVLKELI